MVEGFFRNLLKGRSMVAERQRKARCKQRARRGTSPPLPPMASIDLIPVAFKCPACRNIVRTTRAFLMKPPLACPQCHEPVELAVIQADVRRSMGNFGKTVKELQSVG